MATAKSPPATAPPPTPAEIRANVARTNAEAAKFLAEAREADAKARVAELEASHKERQRAEADAADVHHHVYRFNSEVTESSCEKAISKLTEWHRLDPGCDIEVIFYSPGGSVIDGFTLFDHLRWLSSMGHKITTGCTGMAASMGGVLMQAGDHRWSSGQAWYMIHRAAFGAIGKTFEVEDRVEWIKRIEDRIVAIFVARSHLTRQKILKQWDRRDWWITADEAKELGLVDEIRG